MGVVDRTTEILVAHLLRQGREARTEAEALPSPPEKPLSFSEAMERRARERADERARLAEAHD
jgi:hypothetical protein